MWRKHRDKSLLGVAALLALVLVVVATIAIDAQRGAAADGTPQFVVDAFWPKPLPNNWIMGQASGIAVDGRGHIWVVHRPKSLTDEERGATLPNLRFRCCTPAPPVLEFDAEGNLIQSWTPSGPWPDNEHGVFIDHKDNVWFAGNASGKDGQIFRYTREGKFVMKIGEAGVVGDDADTRHLNRPSNIVVDPTTNELFVSDGYANHRVVVFDAETGAYKRHWGANGRPPGTAGVKQFDGVHCIRVSRDGLVYVCDRHNNRVQIFQRDGTFVKEFIVAPETGGNDGSTWDLNFSADGPQAYLYVADGANNFVWILRRQSGEILGTIGRNGRSAGQFHWIHNLAVDANGAIYTTEVDTGKRVQRFVLRSTASRGGTAR